MFICGTPTAAVELPDTGGACCMNAIEGDPQGCVCWESVFDAEQQVPRPGPPMPRVPVRSCEDCAYLPHSPEREGEAGYSGDTEELDRLVATGTPFFCHQGIRRVVKLRHPSGAEVDEHPANYAPPIIGGVPYKADGSPADICSGWLLRRVAAARARERAETATGTGG